MLRVPVAAAEVGPPIFARRALLGKAAGALGARVFQERMLSAFACTAGQQASPSPSILALRARAAASNSSHGLGQPEAQSSDLYQTVLKTLAVQLELLLWAACVTPASVSSFP